MDFRCAMCGELKSDEERAQRSSNYCKADWNQYTNMRGKAVRRGKTFSIPDYRTWRDEHGLTVARNVQPGRPLDTPTSRTRIVRCVVCEKLVVGDNKTRYKICNSCVQDFYAWREVLGDALTCSLYMEMKVGGFLRTVKGYPREPLPIYKQLIENISEEHRAEFEARYLL